MTGHGDNSTAGEPASTASRTRAAATTPPARELRCDCGNLLARLVAGGVELKCRRCKRTVVVPLSG